MTLRLTRGGLYYRVCDPACGNPADTSYAKRFGGRWNPPGEFGALYLSATVIVAAANARRALKKQFGDAVTFSDIRPERRPDLQTFIVTPADFVDAVTDSGVKALGLPAAFPEACEHGVCQSVARDLYAAGETGIAARSAVHRNGEELAIFDSHINIVRRKPKGRMPFAQWFPGLA